MIRSAWAVLDILVVLDVFGFLCVLFGLPFFKESLPFCTLVELLDLRQKDTGEGLHFVLRNARPIIIGLATQYFPILSPILNCRSWGPTAQPSPTAQYLYRFLKTARDRTQTSILSHEHSILKHLFGQRLICFLMIRRIKHESFNQLRI